MLKSTVVSMIICSLGFYYTLAASEAFEYSGTIVNDLGRLAANATVKLESINDPNNIQSAVTDTTGRFSFVIKEMSKKQDMPFKLYGNFPNPFNSQTRISYSIDEKSDVIILIYNILGQHIRTLYQDFRESGFYTAVWDGKDDFGNVSSAGVYFYKLIAGERVAVSRMFMVDASTGTWIGDGNYSAEAFKNYKENLYCITVTHPDAKKLVVGPITINETSDKILTINRIMNKMQLVGKNTYIRGYHFYTYSKPLHKVKITHDFLMDKYEVTAKAFCDVMNHALAREAVFLEGIYGKNSEGGTQILFRVDTPETSLTTFLEFENGKLRIKEGGERYPITHVSWYGAMFYCYERNIIEGFPQTIDVTDWSCDFKVPGYRLPTDAERELATKWTDDHEYPFGKDTGMLYRPMNTQLNQDRFEEVLSPVGWFSPQGDSHEGVSDLAGNVFEWVWDWFAYYHQEWENSLLVDPTGPPEGSAKVCRGGSAFGCFRAARSGDRAQISIARTNKDIGFRTIRPLTD